VYGPPVTTGATEELVEIEEIEEVEEVKEVEELVEIEEIEEVEDGALDERLEEPVTMLELLTELELVEVIVETTELELEVLEALPLSWYISSLPPPVRE
jgi:hypothetical protein